MYTGDRPDKRTTYVAGKASVMTARLAAIVTKVGTQAVRRYELSYGESLGTRRSLLERVTLCAGATCGAAQLPATVFTYQQDDPNAAFAAPEQLNGPDGMPMGPEWRVRIVGDYDGDGTRDALFSKLEGSVWRRTLGLSGAGRVFSVNEYFPENDDPTQWSGFGEQDDFDYDGRSDLIGWDSATQELLISTWRSGAWDTRRVRLNVGPAAAGAGSSAHARDYDGDGRVDVGFYNKSTGQTQIHQRLCIDRLDCFAPLVTVPPAPVSSPPYQPQMWRDLNGDGLEDTLYDVSVESTVHPMMRLRTGIGSHTDWTLDALGGPADSFSNSTSILRRWADVNGDGLIDIYDPRTGTVFVNRGGSPRSTMFAPVAVVVPGAALDLKRAPLAFVMDVDADGKDEIMVPTVRTRIYCGGDPTRSLPSGDPMWWCGDEFDTATAGGEAYDRSVFKWDAYKFRETSGGTYEMVRVSTSLQAPVRMGIAIDDWPQLQGSFAYGDGMADAQFALLRAYGTRSDGTVILLGFYDGLTETPQQHGPHLSRSQVRAPDLLVGVTNGLGATAAWTHQPLSRPQVPAGCEPASGPFYTANHDGARSPGYVFFTSSMWTVSKFEVGHGVVGTPTATNTSCYRYADAMLSATGRGFQGFKKITSEERLPQALGEETPTPAPGAGGCGPAATPCSVNNLVRTTDFHQEFPLTNRVKKMTVARTLDLAAGRKPLSETEYSWHARATTSPSTTPVAPGIWLVFPSVTIERKYDLGQASGNPLSTTTSIAEIDVTSGEATRRCTIVDDTTAPTGGKVTLSWEDRAALYNDVTSWWLGRVDRQETVTDFLAAPFTPGALPASCPTPPRSADAKIRLVNYAWHPTTAALGSRRKLQSETLVVGGVTESTTTHAYDQFGNLQTTQVTARDVVGTLATSFTYSAAPDQGYFLAAETNPVGHVSTFATDPAMGQERARQEVQGGPWTRSDYDALGRLLTVTPDGAPPASHRVASCGVCGDAVMTRQVIRAGTPTQTEYLDRLGRVVATETEGLAPGSKILTQARYNERGVKVAESPPRFATYAQWSDAAPPPLLTRYAQLDALGRPRTKTVERGLGLFATGKGEPTLKTEYAHAGFKTSIKVFRPPAQGGSLEMSRTVNAQGKLVETVQTVTTPTPHDIVTRYGYDATGAVTRITDTAGNVISATYDHLSRKKTVSDPDRGGWSYTWDGLSRLRNQTDARGVSITQEYDSIGRPTLRTTTAPGNGQTTTDGIWTYDQNGQQGVLSRVEGSSAGTTGAFVRAYSYDDLLRPYRVATTAASDDLIQPTGTRTFTVEYGYDQRYGRMKAIRYPSMSGSGEAVALDYAPTTATAGGGHATGETELLANLARGKQYRRVTTLSPRGAATDQVFGNCTTEHADYDVSSGIATFMTALRPTTVATACPAASEVVRQVEYAYDHFLNLEQQVKNITGIQGREVFTYDDLHRLTRAYRSWGTTPPPGYPAGYTETVSYGYDDLGNIQSKTDYAASYTYGTSARSVRRAGPHAVLSAGTATFDYDLNGNMVSGGGRVIEFDLMDRAVRVCAGSTSPCPAGAVTTDFAYAPDGARYRQRISGPVEAKYGPKTVYYVDKDYELVVWGNLQTEERTYVGGSVVLYRANGGTRQVRYQHLDRLGSVDAVTDANAQKVALDLHGYDPFGKPRAEPWTSSQDRLHPEGDLGATTDRGFTGHEHLDAHHLVHMNGRVYDYRLGRFLSVDPFIADPLDSQAINPYSYIGNNPLSGTDPTGYCPQGDKPGGSTNACGGSARGGTTAPSLADARAQGSIGGRAGSNVTFNGFEQGTAAGQAIFQAWSGATGQRQQPTNSNASGYGGPRDPARTDYSLGHWADKLQFGGTEPGLLESAAAAWQSGSTADRIELAATGVGIGAMAIPYAGDYVSLGASAIALVAKPSWSNAGNLVLDGVGAALPFVPALGTMRRVDRALEAYDVGTYGALKLRSAGDGLDIHHVGQAHAMERVVPGYSRASGPAIAIPHAEHLLIPRLRGEISLAPRQLLARDIWNLRLNTNMPNARLQEVIRLNKEMYPGAFSK